MTDPTLRMPNTVFSAVLDLGQLPAQLPALPDALGQPELDVLYDDDEDTVRIELDFEAGSFHVDLSPDGPGFHFHDAAGEQIEGSPWSEAETRTIIDWMTEFVAHTAPLIPDLFADAEEAAEWCEAGLPVYTREFEPRPLEIIDVLVEGQQMMLPWLGSGHTAHRHAEGPDHPIELLWNPEHEDPHTVIARAWTDPKTGEPESSVVPGINWDAVGMTTDEVQQWTESLYLNHHVLADPADLIIRAALDRIAGFDR